MFFDLTKAVEASTDRAVLFELLTALVGQRCLKADLSYGEELMLHFGDPVPYAHPKMVDEQKGSWILGSRASSWRILLNDPPAIISSGWPLEQGESFGSPTEVPVISGEEAEGHARQLAGKTVNAIRPFKVVRLPTPVGVGVGLVVEFSDGSDVTIVPSPEVDDSDAPVADWELFTPFHTYLRVGPGLVWSYLRSDKVPQNA
jgi:hypothetical protein